MMSNEGDEDFKIIIRGTKEVRQRSVTPEAVSERLLEKPTIIHLFSDGPESTYDIDELKGYLESTLGSNFTIVNEGDFFERILKENPDKRDDIVVQLAEAKKWASAADYLTRFPEPLNTETKKTLVEKELDRDQSKPIRDFTQKQNLGGERPGRIRYISNNEYYSITELGNIYNEYGKNLIKDEVQDGSTKHLSLVITGRGLGENSDHYAVPHARAAFTQSNFAVVSTTGIIHGPAQPIELQHRIQIGHQSGIYAPDERDKKRYESHLRLLREGKYPSSQALRDLYSDVMIGEDDKRMTEASKGYILQMLLYASGEPETARCSTSNLSEGPDKEKFCRMHDSHYQEELVATQIKKEDEPEFCDNHTRLFELLQKADK